MRTKISIVIAVYNGANTIEKCIDSIIHQTYKNIDILISDGSSTDGTVEILKKHSSKLYFWESKVDGGIADAWNNALDHIRSDWVLFIGADDFLACNTVIEKMVNHLDDSYDIIYGNLILRYFNKDIQIGNKFDLNKFKKRMTIPHTAAFHNSRLFLENNRYDVNYKIALDYEFLLRKNVNSFKYINELVTIMSAGGMSSNQTLKSLKESKNAKIKHEITSKVIAEIHYYFYKLYLIIKEKCE